MQVLALYRSYTKYNSHHIQYETKIKSKMSLA